MHDRQRPRIAGPTLMVFSSLIFLFAFLPAVLAAHVVCPRPLRNTLLLCASLLFYAWGEPVVVFLMVCSIGVNYVLGLAIARARATVWSPVYVAAGLGVNLGLLGIFKYADFVVANANLLRVHFGFAPWQPPHIALPIGISFFTFQALSYLLDVYRGTSDAQRNPTRLALFIALFPQLIAGPIVRYHDIAAQLARRTVSLADFAEGVHRFVVGLAKKTLIANTLAVPADAVFALGAMDLRSGVAWLGVLCYTGQIYFDFSGYSDMAIGLARMFGFRLLENFQYPYIARSLRDFWRRWHISLSNWFRDYLYIPLGGNRYGASRTGLHLVTVFFLCGLWHGASWTYVVWGLYHGLFLVLERHPGMARLLARARPAAHVYTLLVVMVGWTVFRADTLTHAWTILRAIAGLAQAVEPTLPLSAYLNAKVALALAAGALGALPWVPALVRWYASRVAEGAPIAVALRYVHVATLVTLLGAAALSLSAGTHNPFIYFRF